MIFGFSILATAILLSCVAAYYSVAGLTAIFSAATIPVIIMGGSLELGKIVATVWLHNNWRRAPFLFKAYLVPAVAFLMLLTSMGIFGYLSKAHSDQSLVSGDAVAKVAIYDEKISTAKDNIAMARKALKQMDESVDQVMGRSDDEKGADKAVALRRGQAKERARLLAEIEVEQRKVASLSEERAPLAAEFRKVESEVGPIKYIAALVYGDNPDANVLERAVRLVIIMIVLVFDPLALTLILAANKQFEWALHGRGGWVHDEDDRAAMAIVPPKEEEIRPFTEEEVAALNKDPEPEVDRFAYLKQPFVHFQNLKPMVATPDPSFVYQPEPPKPITDFPELQEAIKKGLEDGSIVIQGAADIPDVERPGDYITPPEHEEDDEEDDEIKAAIKKWKTLNPNDTIKNQRYKLLRGEIAELPWMGLVADNAPSIETKSGFGTTFPKDPNRGDTFVRVDQLPSVVYKYNGTNWMEVDKNLTDSYTYDTAYIDHLIDRIASGEYDAELLSDTEREQVAERLQQHNSNT